MTGCVGGGDAAVPAGGAGTESAGTSRTRTIQAERLLQVTQVHESTGMTLLEGPVLDDEGRLYVVDVTAPPGAPKVLRVDLHDETVESIYTDESSALTSAQFSPHDGRLYVTDDLGTIRAMTPDGEDAVVFFVGDAAGIPLAPDDISFDADGHLYVTDTRGAQDPYWEASGRLIRIDRDGANVSVLAEGLAAPNGIAFTPAGDALWLSHNTGSAVDVLRLDETGTAVSTAHPGLRPDVGIAQVDSLATDAAGNLYLGLHNRPAILVYDRYGEHLATVAAPTDDADVTSATNVAISPDATTAYATFSGPGGGYIYTFEALASGIRSSNGG
ncbi:MULTISPECIES: SMP-30/gluconolactonase/LRE family protein [unclassified Microbacterium]|uniref:SMP-30/gluconolactonase/LRE family protein n=1 Tax=Microbacterium TaxID=33882 RepID=UPI003BA27FC8